MIKTKLETSVLRCICLILVITLCLSLLAGCSDKTVSVRPYRNINGSLIETQLLASNEKYTLSWDRDAKAVLFEEKATGKVWSDILYNSVLEGSTNANANSPIGITVADTRTLKWDTVKSYTALSDGGKIVSKKIENGIRVTYFFDTYKIAVPIEYQLRDDSLLVTVLADQILEDGEQFKLVSVSVAPFMCSASNENEGSYIFVPSGSGALMYAQNTPEGTRKYTGEVYGHDGGRQLPISISDNESIHLPVFGAKDGAHAILGIIEQGAGSAVLEAQTSNERLGYSNIGVTFYVRGYDEFNYASFATGNTILKQITDDLISQRPTVAYYPLSGEDADYNGMAKKYREYLLENELLRSSDTELSPYSVTLLGGTNVTVSTLGIPRKKLVSMTSYTQAAEIFSDLIKENEVAPVLRMMGYGDNGIKPGSVVGGNKLSSAYGSKKQFSAFQELCKKNNALLFIDFDVLKYSESGNGFSLKGDSANTAIGNYVRHRFISPLRENSSNTYTIVSRENLDKSVDKAIKNLRKYSNTAISLSSLGSIAYSDYSYKQYYLKNGIETDVIKQLTKISDNGYNSAVASANSYAAGFADVLFDITVDSGDNTAFDEQIPFYQMVFHSYKPMYTDAVNLSDNATHMITKAISSGMGLGYTVTYEYIDNSNDVTTDKLYGMVYEDVKDDIKNALSNNSFADIYSRIKTSVFESYEIIGNGVTKSTFANGVKIYANHTSKKVSSPIGEIEAYGYLVDKEGT